jgi:hypothetical protein
MLHHKSGRSIDRRRREGTGTRNHHRRFRTTPIHHRQNRLAREDWTVDSVAPLIECGGTDRTGRGNTTTHSGEAYDRCQSVVPSDNTLASCNKDVDSDVHYRSTQREATSLSGRTYSSDDLISQLDVPCDLQKESNDKDERYNRRRLGNDRLRSEHSYVSDESIHPLHVTLDTEKKSKGTIRHVQSHLRSEHNYGMDGLFNPLDLTFASEKHSADEDARYGGTQEDDATSRSEKTYGGDKNTQDSEDEEEFESLSSESTGSNFVPSIDDGTNSDLEWDYEMQASPMLKKRTAVHNKIPKYKVDPIMFIAFEISDPTTTERRGDIGTKLSPDRVERGMIKYVLVIPIFERTIYLKRNAHCDCHYGVWNSEIGDYVVKANECCIDVLILEDKVEEDNDFIVMHGKDCTAFDAFSKLVARCESNQITNEKLTIDENRNTMSSCFGFSTANYELDDVTQVHKPAIKCNMNRYAGQTMLLLGELLDQVDFSGHFHAINPQRQRNYAARIGIECGMSSEDSRKLYLEGMTYNRTTISCNGSVYETVSPSRTVTSTMELTVGITFSYVFLGCSKCRVTKF